MGATLGSKALSLPMIIILAAIFETFGAVLLGNFVGSTISVGLVNFDEFFPVNGTEIVASTISSVGTANVANIANVANAASKTISILPMHSSIWTQEFINGIFQTQDMEVFAQLYMLSMCSVLFGSSIFLAIATLLALPVSTTHAVVGSVLGNGIIIALFLDPKKVGSAIRWEKLIQIVISWILSPFVGCFFSFISWLILKLLLFDHRKSKYFILGASPILFGVTGGILSLFILQKGISPALEGLHIFIPWWIFPVGSVVLGILITIVCIAFIPIFNWRINSSLKLQNLIHKNQMDNQIKEVATQDVSEDKYFMMTEGTNGNVDVDVEIQKDEISSLFIEDSQNSNQNDYSKIVKDITERKVFRALVIVTSCCIATAHGAGDISNASGPLDAIIFMFNERKIVHKDTFYNTWWCTIITAVGLVIGLSTLGYRVMRTLGTKIAKFTPARAYISQFCTAFITLTFSILGLPISTTHVVVGAIYGITFVDILTIKDVTWRSLNFKLIIKILSSWALTLPLAALFSGIILIIFKLILRY